MSMKNWSFTREDLENVTIDTFKSRNGLEYYLYQFNPQFTLPVIGFFAPRHKYMDSNVRRFNTLSDAKEYWEDLKIRMEV